MKLMDPQNILSQPQPIEPDRPKTHRPFLLPLIIGCLLLILSVGVGVFYLGKTTNLPKAKITPAPTISLGKLCAQDAKICPDGLSVGRTGTNCNFAPCPTNKIQGEGKFCGGIAGVTCPVGYQCVLDGNYPDAGGTCQKKISTLNQIKLEDICNNNNYQSVKKCGEYFITTRPCCDQPGDILDSQGKNLATCGGLIPPTPPPSCIKYLQLLKTIDQSNCVILRCPTK